MKKTILLSILIGLGLMLVLVGQVQAKTEKECETECLSIYPAGSYHDIGGTVYYCIDRMGRGLVYAATRTDCEAKGGTVYKEDELKASSFFQACKSECLVPGSTECQSQCIKIDPARGDIFARCVEDCLKSPIAVKADIVEVLDTVINWISVIIGTIATLMIIIGGIMYMTAGGNEEKVGKAKNVLKYAVIGLVIALIAWGVKTIILSFM